MMSSSVRSATRAPIMIVPYKNTSWGWKKVNRRLRTPSLLSRLQLLPVEWSVVIAPKGTACELTTGGKPLYRYKRLNEAAYYLEPKPRVSSI